MKNRNKRLNSLLTKEFLVKEYITNKKSTLQIAKEIGCGCSTINRHLIKYNIPIRTIGESLKGKNSPNYIDGRTNKKHYCLDCGKEITWQAKRCRICNKKIIGSIAKERLKDPRNHPMFGKLRPDVIIRNKKRKGCNHYNYGKKRPLHSEKMSGSNHFNWQGGIGKAPYPFEFNKILKEQIRQRDNHQCQICGKTTKQNGKKLDIHHIDYDKNNLDPENLISLCHNCHMKTNFNRDIYIEYFKILKGILNERS